MTRVSPQDHRFTVDEDMSTQVIILDNDESEIKQLLDTFVYTYICV